MESNSHFHTPPLYSVIQHGLVRSRRRFCPAIQSCFCCLTRKPKTKIMYDSLLTDIYRENRYRTTKGGTLLTRVESTRLCSHSPLCFFQHYFSSYITQTPGWWTPPGSVSTNFVKKRHNSKKNLLACGTDIFGAFWYHDDFVRYPKISAAKPKVSKNLVPNVNRNSKK